MKIAVLYTELLDRHSSAESQSILIDARQVHTTLENLGYQSEMIPFCLWDLTQTTKQLQAYHPDLVFNLVDEVDGIAELSHLPTTFLSALRYRHTGCSGVSLAMTTDKVLSKKIFLTYNIPTADWLCFENLNRPLIQSKLIVKNRYLDGSAGLDEDQLTLFSDGPELRELLARQKDLVAEVYIDGREFTVPIFMYQGKVLSPGAAETVFKDFPPDKLKVVGSRSKWAKGSFEYEHTIANFIFPPEDSTLIAKMQEIAQRCWTTLQLCSYARVDFRVDRDNQPWVLEVNGNPSIEQNDWLAAVAEESGISYPNLIKGIVDAACAI